MQDLDCVCKSSHACTGLQNRQGVLSGINLQDRY